MNIDIVRDYYDQKDYLYQYNELNLEPGLTVLIGCNGSGKTTLLHQIERYCKKDNIKYFSFNNYTEGGSNAMSRAGFFGDIDSLAQDFISSEGERIGNNIARMAPKIGSLVRGCEPGEKLFILFDAIDSGLSIDGVIDTKENLLNVIVDDCENKGIEVYIIASANKFELARNVRSLNVVTGKFRKLNNYEDYAKEILSTFKYKKKRYKQEIYFDIDSYIKEFSKK